MNTLQVDQNISNFAALNIKQNTSTPCLCFEGCIKKVLDLQDIRGIAQPG